MSTYERALACTVDAALRAGALLREDFHRPDGPRGAGAHAPADAEAERVIREALTRGEPGWGYLGEETGSEPPEAGNPHLWIVDPNDGTSSYIKGFRGSAVSIGLLRDGQPVLGVVYAFSAPDDGGDLCAWAEGCGPIRRNGQATERPAWPVALKPHDVVLLSQAMGRKAAANLHTAAPARCRSMPSIAYRLALTAVGEGAIAVSLNSPGGWDYAAGHALLKGAGGTLVDERGDEVRYTRDGSSGTACCFGGAPALVRAVAARDWAGVCSAPADPPERYDLVQPAPGAAVRDAAALARAQGCLLGQLAGDALGSLVEFRSAGEIAAAHPTGVRALVDGGTWDTIAGQPTDDSELALMLARSIVDAQGYEPQAAARAYSYWYRSSPFDCGRTTGQALRAIDAADITGGTAAQAAARAASRRSESNGSLMRVSPLSVWGCSIDPNELAGHARTDSALTHPTATCCEAVAVYAVAVGHAIRTGETAAEVYDHALRWAERMVGQPEVIAALRAASAGPPPDFLSHQGWVLIAFQNAFYRLLQAPTAAAGIIDTVMAGGDTDTNAAIAGALLGAVHGREAIPPDWRQSVLTCRPLAGLPGIRRPRPRAFWPVDALELAERLVWLGSRFAGSGEPTQSAITGGCDGRSDQEPGTRHATAGQ